MGVLRPCEATGCDNTTVTTYPVQTLRKTGVGVRCRECKGDN